MQQPDQILENEAEDVEEQYEEQSEMSDADQQTANIKQSDLDQFEAALARHDPNALQLAVACAPALHQQKLSKRYLISLLSGQLVASHQLVNKLCAGVNECPEQPLLLAVVAKFIQLTNETQRKRLMEVADGCLESAFTQAFVSSVSDQPSGLRLVRKLVKQQVYSQQPLVRQVVTCLRSSKLLHEILANLIRELALFQAGCRQGKASLLFSTPKKINRTTKQIKAKTDGSVEEKCAERLASKPVLSLVSVICQLVPSVANLQERRNVTFPLVETVLHVFNYLVTYPRAHAFILLTAQQMMRNITQFFPVQQILIHLLAYAALPIPKSSLDVNPAQYRAKLYDEKSAVTFKNQPFVPQQFVKTLQYREAISQLIVETAYLSVVAHLRSQAVTLPEATNGFRSQLSDLQKVLEGKEPSRIFGYKFEYRAFQYGFQKGLVEKVRTLRTHIAKDAEKITEMRKGIDLHQAAKKEFGSDFECVKEAERLMLNLKQEAEVQEAHVQHEEEKKEKEIYNNVEEELEEFEEFEEAEEHEGDVLRDLEL